MIRTKWAAAAAAMTIVPLGLVACGSGSEQSAGAATTAPEAGESMSHGGVAGATNAAAADLRVTLDRLLAEHALLAVFTMQKGVSGAEDFKASAGALEQNTQDLGAAIGSVYGKKAEQSFLKQWREHIGFFVDYTVATAKGDEAGRNAARDDLARYQASFAKFLGDATGGELPADAAAEALQAHVDQLVTALDTYAAGDYEQAYAQAREAYAHMFMTGDALAGAIVEQSPEKFGG